MKRHGQSIRHETVVFGGYFIYDFEKEEFCTHFASIKNKQLQQNKE